MHMTVGFTSFFHMLYHIEAAGLLEQSLDEAAEVPVWRKYKNRMSFSIQYTS